MRTKKELTFKPCPFCGCNQVGIWLGDQPRMTLVKCRACSASKRVSSRMKHQIAVEWNVRNGAPPDITYRPKTGLTRDFRLPLT